MDPDMIPALPNFPIRESLVFLSITTSGEQITRVVFIDSKDHLPVVRVLAGLTFTGSFPGSRNEVLVSQDRVVRYRI